MSTAVKRACDACHRRKVKCDGINPCRNCSSAQLTCTYNAIPQKKGPKGSRAKVISELRETQRATSLSAKVQNRMSGITSPPSSPSMHPTPGLLTSEMVKDCVEFFFANMYPIMPILNRQRLEQQALYMDSNRDTYCLLTGLCAFMMIQPGMHMPSGDPMGLDNMPGANIISGQLLLEEAIKVRRGYDYLESPTLNSLCTSYFLFGCYYGLDLHEKAWFHLREATTIAYMIGMTKEETYLQYDNVESSRRRRLYWLLFVTERAYALQRQRPLTLQSTINLPSLTDDPTDPLAHQLNGFILLVNLFKPFDDVFVAIWNKTRGECQSNYLAALQKQLNDSVPPYMNGADTPLADLRTNQQWLKTMTWQLSIQDSEDPNMRFQLSMDVSRDLMSMQSQFSTRKADMLGTPYMLKVFDIACALTDVLSMQPSSGDPFTVGPQEQLHQLLQILSSLRNGQHHFLHLLLNKVHDILPRLATPMLQRVPENACNIDIFDGFGNAGMAQPPMMMREYDQKSFAPQSAPLPRLDDVHTDSGSSTGAPSGAELNSPFPMVSSPGNITSPSIEFPHMGADIKPDIDMMTPLSAIPQHGWNHNSSMSSHQQQQHNMYSQNMNQNNGMDGQLQNNMDHGLNGSLNNINGMGRHQQHIGQTQNFEINRMSGNIGQSIMANSLLHRQPPQRSNSFIHQQNHQQQSHQQNHQQTPQIPRTVGDFHALQRANSDGPSINSMGISPMGAEMDYGGMR